MNQQLRVTVVVDNTVRRSDLLAEHGLSFWIEAGERRILFDTGQGKVLRHNLQALAIDAGTTDTVVLSHGHYDHTGGLAGLLDDLGRADMYMHPAALEEKYSRRDQPPHREIGSKSLSVEMIRARVRRLIWNKAPTQIGDDVFVTGEIPRHSDFEDVGGPFYLDEACTNRDPLVDNQALYIQTAKGVVIFLGCAHAGVVNTLDYIATLTGQDRFHAVIGGLQLQRASPERLTATVEAFARYGVHEIVSGHCTGSVACIRLHTEFPGRCQECAVGVRFDLGST